jgi:hypothetical protein
VGNASAFPDAQASEQNATPGEAPMTVSRDDPAVVRWLASVIGRPPTTN